MNPLRIGLAGYGNWAREAYMPALRADGRGNVVAASAPSQATRQRIREELGSRVRIYPHFDAMLEAGGLDGVLMALPEAVHEPGLLAAIASRTPFFYEPRCRTAGTGSLRYWRNCWQPPRSSRPTWS